MGDFLLWGGLACLWAIVLIVAVYHAVNREPKIKEPRHDR